MKREKREEKKKEKKRWGCDEAEIHEEQSIN
jgi:hypothetical protein